jgi:hypothetical protein
MRQSFTCDGLHAGHSVSPGVLQNFVKQKEKEKEKERKLMPDITNALQTPDAPSATS